MKYLLTLILSLYIFSLSAQDIAKVVDSIKKIKDERLIVIDGYMYEGNLDRLKDLKVKSIQMGDDMAPFAHKKVSFIVITTFRKKGL